MSIIPHVTLQISENQATRVIQKFWRGYKTRKTLKTPYDNMTLSMLQMLLINFIEQYYFIKRINNNLQKNYKKIRQNNFPSEISENIAKFSLLKVFPIMPNWNTKHGDLQINNTIIEVKAFSSDGPVSFRPSEKWDYLCFVDCRNFLKEYFDIYLLKRSNNSKDIQNMYVNATEIFHKQCLQKRRPRITFNAL